MPVVSGATRRTEGLEKCYWARFPWASLDMQTTGRTPSPPSHDSLSSSDSFLFSDSEAVEDDTDVFLSEGDAAHAHGHARSPSSSRFGLHGDALSSPSSQWACDGLLGQRERPAPVISGSRAAPLSASVSSSSTSGAWSASESEGGSERSGQSHGDQLFAQKCVELQCFVRPLLELLHGLKNGRFDKGLSSFQQSVAMDRIQRIVGVLQKPSSGEKYLNTLLQVEMMLKLWFPQISALASPAPQGPTTPRAPANPSAPSNSSTPPHKHKDQLHMPVKKRRLSWSDTDSSSTPSPVLCKRFQLTGGDPGGSSLDRESRESRSSSAPTHQSCGDSADEPSSPPAPRWSEPSLTWVHLAPILSPRTAGTGAAGAGAGAGPGVGVGAGAMGSSVGVVAPPQASRGSPAMQDCSISSTTPPKQPRDAPPKQPRDPLPNPTHDSPLQGKRQATAPPITTRPLSRAEPGATSNPVQS